MKSDKSSKPERALGAAQTRGRAKPQIINGREFPNREFQQYLIEALKAQPEEVASSAAFVAEFFCDPKWDTTEGRDKIYRKLKQMSEGKKSRVELVSRGVFRVRAKTFGAVDNTDFFEQKIIAYLRTTGGLAKRKDILDHLGLFERSEQTNLDKMLAKSAKVRRDFNLRDRAHVDSIKEDRIASTKGASVGKASATTRASTIRLRLANMKGVINLHPNQLHGMILQGRWARRFFTLSAWGMPHATETNSTPLGADLADDFLRNIGHLAQRLREEALMSIDELVDRPGMMQALNAAAFRYTRRDKTLLRRAGMDAYKNEAADPHELRVQMYVRFEGGEDEKGIDLYRAAAHTAMRDDFYEAWAALYSLDPVALSRGVTMPMANESDFRNTDWEAFFADDDAVATNDVENEVDGDDDDGDLEEIPLPEGPL